MDKLKIGIPVDGKEYKVTITNIYDNRGGKGGNFTMNYYVVPRVEDKDTAQKIKHELNTICNNALNNYLDFNKERYE